jgi:hypothetical protein
MQHKTLDLKASKSQMILSQKPIDHECAKSLLNNKVPIPNWFIFVSKSFPLEVG